MGNDGGSILRRKDIVHVRAAETAKRDVDADVLGKVAAVQCAISRQPLRKPIVSDRLGRLYNKDSVLQYLLGRSKKPDAKPSPLFNHLRGLKDVRELKLMANPAYKVDDVATRADDSDAPMPFICPLTQREMNGRHRFVYLPCGCVMSESGLRAMLADQKSENSTAACPVCSTAFDAGSSLEKHKIIAGGDVVIVNGTADEVEAQRKAMYEARDAEKTRKKELKAAKIDDDQDANRKAAAKKEKRKCKEELVRSIDEERTGAKRQRHDEMSSVKTMARIEA